MTLRVLRGRRGQAAYGVIESYREHLPVSRAPCPSTLGEGGTP